MNEPRSSDSISIPEAVAFQLLVHVMAAEGRPLGAEGVRLSRNLILDVYAECLEAVRGQREKRAPRRTA